MIRFARETAVAAAVMATAGTATAGEPIALSLDFHLTGATFDCATAVDQSTITCTDIVADGPFAGASNHLFVLMGGLGDAGTVNGGTAVQFGIDFESTGETSIWQTWSSCGQFLQIPAPGANGAWPSSGSGISVAFGVCINPPNPSGLMAVGYFFATAPLTIGEQSFVPGPHEVIMTDCNNLTHDIAVTGTFSFEGQGNVACGALPTQERSWGQIKSMF